MTTMQDTRGAEYVAAWPATIGRMVGLSPEYVVEAVNTVTGSSIPRTAARNPDPIAEVGALTGEQAIEVLDEVRRISSALTAHSAGHCHTCGLPLRVDRCIECDY